MQRIMPWVGAWLLATVAWAQETPPQAPAKPATAAERFAALQAAQKQAVTEWQQQMKDAQAKAAEAKAAGKAMPAMSMRPDFSKLVGQAKEAAAAFAGTADAPQFLVYIVQNSTDMGERSEALDTLTSKHVSDAAVAGLAPMLPFLDRIVSPAMAKTCRERLATSENADVRGWVAFAQHQATIEKAPTDGDDYKAARTALLAAADAATDARLKGEIKSTIDTREKFGIGNTAPDIAGVDLDGVPFKLSDYKGKVVFLDFWGDW